MEPKIKIFMSSLNQWFEEDVVKIKMTNNVDCTLIMMQQPSPYKGDKDRLKIIKDTESNNKGLIISPSSSNSFFIE